jgi:hypothetical protein
MAIVLGSLFLVLSYRPRKLEQEFRQPVGQFLEQCSSYEGYPAHDWPINRSVFGRLLVA